MLDGLGARLSPMLTTVSPGVTLCGWLKRLAKGIAVIAASSERQSDAELLATEMIQIFAAYVETKYSQIDEQLILAACQMFIIDK